MAIRTTEEIMETMRSVLGDQTADTALTALEDISDTLNDLNTRVADATDWKKKYEDNDAEWRQKYRDRFYAGSPPVKNEPVTEVSDDQEDAKPKLKTTYESLFSEVS